VKIYVLSGEGAQEKGKTSMKLSFIAKLVQKAKFGN
jgi:hypothetical protein